MPALGSRGHQEAAGGTASRVTLEWFGCTTVRPRVGDGTLFLGAFLDRVPSCSATMTTFWRPR